VAVGYDNLDVAYARSKGVVCTNTPGVLTDATADLTWALILAVTRRLGEGERLLRRGEWKGFAFDFMLGTSLRGKQLGIVGAGRIGRGVAERAGAFGMTVAYSSRRQGVWQEFGADDARSPARHVRRRQPARAARRPTRGT
jgi:glyoxylate reductase